MKNRNVTEELVRKGGRGSYSLYLIRVNGRAVGLLEKYPNTRTETHPWKAFLGVGLKADYQGAFYAEDGGKKAALDAILSKI